MKRVLYLGSVVAALTLLMPPAAVAKDACVSLFAGTGTLVFHKVKPVKKAGKTTPLYGVYLQSGAKASASGSATMGADDQVVFGVFVHSMDPVSANNITFTVIGAPISVVRVSSTTTETSFPTAMSPGRRSTVRR